MIVVAIDSSDSPRTCRWICVSRGEPSSPSLARPDMKESSHPEQKTLQKRRGTNFMRNPTAPSVARRGFRMRVRARRLLRMRDEPREHSRPREGSIGGLHHDSGSSPQSSLCSSSRRGFTNSQSGSYEAEASGERGRGMVEGVTFVVVFSRVGGVSRLFREVKNRSGLRRGERAGIVEVPRGGVSFVNIGSRGARGSTYRQPRSRRYRRGPPRRLRVRRVAPGCCARVRRFRGVVRSSPRGAPTRARRRDRGAPRRRRKRSCRRHMPRGVDLGPRDARDVRWSEA